MQGKVIWFNKEKGYVVKLSKPSGFVNAKNRTSLSGGSLVFAAVICVLQGFIPAKGNINKHHYRGGVS
ncbi:MAG: hypothetical protein ABSC17_07160 [Thermacetogeniaceae bacterium]